MPDFDREDVDSPLFWELSHMFGPRFAQSPWSPEFLETPLPTTFSDALDYYSRRVASRQDTQVLPILALDRYAQEVDLDATEIKEIIEGVLVDD